MSYEKSQPDGTSRRSPTPSGGSHYPRPTRRLHSNSSVRRSQQYNQLNAEGILSDAAAAENIPLQRRSNRPPQANGYLQSESEIDNFSHDETPQLTRSVLNAEDGGDEAIPRPKHHDSASSYRSREHAGDNESMSARSETTFRQRRDLGTLDVAALIINKQIGTGIFTTPGLVLSLTGSKTTSIVMWFCGGIWALLSVIIYVEFGSAFPFNGGELIYLDEVFRRPELLATVLFSAFFIMVPNTDGNSLQFAKHVLLAANPSVTETTQLDKRLLSFVAISVLTVVCLIHYFSRNSGLLLNLLFAAFKIVLVSVFIIFGGIASAHSGNGTGDWGSQPVTSKNVLAGMIYIIYSYQGWENANYVGGELKVTSSSLKRGAFLAVCVTTTLYTLVTMVYQLACTFDELRGQDLGVVSNFAPKAFGKSGVTGIKICIALSAFGNLVAVVYTSSKVKQQIARQCIMPFYKFFAREDTQFKTPGGALILHWVFAVIWIIGTPNTSNGYGFVIGLFIYGQLIVGVFVAIAFFFIRQNYESERTRNDGFSEGPPKWTPVILKNKYIRTACALVFMGMNLMVIIEAARNSGYPPAWVRPVVIFGLLVIATGYWGVIRAIEKRSNSESALEIRIVRDGVGNPSPADLVELQKAKMEMNSRVVIYEVHGTLERILDSLSVSLHKVVRVLVR